jgi:hypothetical protein
MGNLMEQAGTGLKMGILSLNLNTAMASSMASGKNTMKMEIPGIKPIIFTDKNMERKYGIMKIAM